MKSKFSVLMKKYPENSSWSWRDELKEKYPDIFITEEESSPYVLFRYSIGCDFNDPLVQEARGIILDKNTGEVACWPFRKFGKFYEPYADKIDWESATVLEKLDGSIIKLWFDKYKEKFVFSTNGVIYAENAYVTSDKDTTFMELIERAANYDDLLAIINAENVLDKNKTYIFELVGADNKVVINYDKPLLYHIGTRNNITGEESDDDIGIIKPTKYNVSTLDECIELANSMSEDENGVTTNCAVEGFVVVDKNWNRIKVKSSIYQILHNIVAGSEVSRYNLIKMLYDNTIDVYSVSRNFPELAVFIKYYDYQVSEYIHEANRIINVTRKLYEDSNHDRKTVANLIKDHPYSGIAFNAIDNIDTLDEILDRRKEGKYLYLTRKIIEPYSPMPLNMVKEYYSKNE